MAQVAIRDVRKAFGAVEVIKGVNIDIEDGAVRRAGRPVRLRQVDDAADDRRAREHHAAAIIRIGDRVVNDLPPRTATSPWCSSPTRSTRT